MFYQDIPNAKTYKVSLDGKVTALKLDSKKARGTTIAADGKTYTAAGNQVLVYDPAGKESVYADSVAGNDLIITKMAIYM